MNKFFFVVLLVLPGVLSIELKAQDPQFSQYYASPLYLNPAFAGSTQAGRAGVNYRNQWPSLDANFVTYSGFFDYHIDDYNSSVGLLLTTDQEGLAGLRSTGVSAIYAYQFFLSDGWIVRPAVQAGFMTRDLNFGRLTFGDQFDQGGFISQPSAESFMTGLQTTFLDLSFGGVAFSERAWIGVAAHHVNRPNQSLIGEDDVNLPVKFSIHGGYKFPLGPSWTKGANGERSISPTFNYRSQGPFDQLDIGTYLTLEPVLFGLWYRGIPFKTVEGIPNNESFVFMVGLNHNDLTFGYSFDYTISTLGIGSGGAHEVSIIYTFNWGDPRKPPRDIRNLKCPVPFIF